MSPLAQNANMVELMTTIQVHLRDRTIQYAQRAVAAYSNKDLSDLALFAGIAAELGVKAVLAARNPMLVAGDHKRDALQIDAAAGSVNDLQFLSVRSAQAADALDTLLLMHPSLGKQRSAAERLFHARNSEAHMGLPQIRDPLAHLGVLIKFLESAFGVECDSHRQQLWGQQLETTAKASKEYAQKGRADASAAIAKHSAWFEQLPSNDYEDLLASCAEDQRKQVDNRTTMALECPVCRLPGIAEGFLEANYQGEGEPSLDFTIVGFRCLGLKKPMLILREEAALEVAGIVRSKDCPNGVWDHYIEDTFSADVGFQFQ